MRERSSRHGADARSPAGNDSGSPYFREPLDIVLGFLNGDGDFITYHFDSRRFAPVIEQKP